MANDITILSCPICNNPKLREYGNGIYQCVVCETYFDKDENIVLTEQEWLQTLDTEQLAEVFADVALSVHPFMKQKNRFELLKKHFYVWLKQPHKGN